MKTIIKTYVPFIAVVLACFEFSPKAQAVVPAPDGCYPNYTTAEGCNALQNLVGGAGNTGVGWRSLFSAVNGSFNTGVGAGTLLLNTADSNTAIGAAAMLLNTTGTQNTAVGTDALVYNDSGSGNTANGYQALYSNTDGFSNTANGYQALYRNTTGTYNTAIGESAGGNLTTGSGNVCIGDYAGLHVTGGGNVCIGNEVFGLAGDNSITRIKNISATPIASNYLTVVVDNGGTRLGYAASSRRYKKEIAPMARSSQALFELKPVTYRGKEDAGPRQAKCYGLIAEEVAEVAPDLVAFNRDGEPETVRFDSVNAMLLNEFLKEHKKVEEQERKIQDQDATITQLKKEMGTVVARLKEQDSKIQKVADQVEMSKAAPQVAAIK
jgi:hypothetical protein